MAASPSEAAVVADGNGIYDGSGSLVANTVVSGTTFNLQETYANGGDFHALYRDDDTFNSSINLTSGISSEIAHSGSSLFLEVDPGGVTDVSNITINNDGTTSFLTRPLFPASSAELLLSNPTNDLDIAENRAYIRVFPTVANLELTGIANGGLTGATLFIHNEGVFALVLAYDDAGSAIGNRFNELPNNEDYIIPPGAGVQLVRHPNRS